MEKIVCPHCQKTLVDKAEKICKFLNKYDDTGLTRHCVYCLGEVPELLSLEGLSLTLSVEED